MLFLLFIRCAWVRWFGLTHNYANGAVLEQPMNRLLVKPGFGAEGQSAVRLRQLECAPGPMPMALSLSSCDCYKGVARPDYAPQYAF